MRLAVASEARPDPGWAQLPRVGDDPGRTLRAVVFNLNGKERGVAQALHHCGHKLVADPEDADIALIDFPAGWGGQRLAMTWWFAERGVPVVSYPHGAAPLVSFGGVTDPCARLTAELVHGEGHREILSLLGYPVPVEVIGWSYSPVEPFSPVETVGRLLFAPAHPQADGSLRDEWKAANASAYQGFLDHPAPVKTVRMHGTWEQNGLWPDDRVTSRVYADLMLDWSDIDNADAVVSEGTFAYLAVARGKPTVMFGQQLLGRPDHGTRQVRDWERVFPLMRYPLAVEDGPFDEVLASACVGGPDVDRWKTRMVGEPLDPYALCALLDRYVRAA